MDYNASPYGSALLHNGELVNDKNSGGNSLDSVHRDTFGVLIIALNVHERLLRDTMRKSWSLWSYANDWHDIGSDRTVIT